MKLLYRVLLRQLPVDHTAAAIGIEWGWGYSGGGEGTLIAEGQFVFAPDASAVERDQLGPFQRDGLIGYRHTLNDIDSSEFMLGVIADFERLGESLMTMSASTRLSDVWSARLSLRGIYASDEDSLLSNI